MQAAAAANDEANGAHYAEELATLEADLNDNKCQADSLEQLYKQNTQIIAESLREIQKFQREFEAVKAKVAIGRSLENLSGMMKSSITELQGMMGGEMGQSMQQLRQSAAVRRGPDARDARPGQGNGLGHRPPAGGPQDPRRGAVPGIQEEDGHGATGSRCGRSPPPPAQPERQKIPEQ